MSHNYFPSNAGRFSRRRIVRSRRSQFSATPSESLEARIVLAAPTYSLVKDLNTLPSDTNPNIDETVQVGTVTFFTAETLAEGKGLWKSDGTTAGTVFVKSVDADQLVNMNGVLYFRGYDSVRGSELWRSNGTAAGTTVVSDIVAGPASSSPDSITVVGTTLYFAATTPSSGTELWKSDGTAIGTVLVKDILVGTGSSGVDHIAAVGTNIFFTASNGTAGSELWKSNGTAGGTTLVRDIEVGASGSYPERLVNAGGTLFFGAYDSTHNYALWKSDGTNAGTIAVLSNLPGSNSVQNAVAVGSTLFFTYDDEVHGRELWKSNGTVAGTVMVKDLDGDSGGSYPDSLTNVGGVLYFGAIANNARTGELWKSNGTAAGTVLVHSTPSEERVEAAQWITNVNGVVYFYAPISNDLDVELWKSNGTTAGTVLVKDIFPGTNSSDASFGVAAPFNANGKLFFTANDGTHGPDLWRSDGTAAGTTLLKEIRGGTADAEVKNLTNLNGTLIFTARDNTNGRNSIWRLNGSTPVLVKNTWPGSDVTFHEFIVIGGNAYFIGDSNDGGSEIWKTDGTTAGTVMVKDINPGGTGSGPLYLTVVGNKFFFSAFDPASGRELWVSDGTSAGTKLVKDIVPGEDSSIPYAFANVNGALYFTAKTSTSGYELWKSDGTSAGTIMVKEIRSGSGSAYPAQQTNVNGTLYFSANDGTNGHELWKSDGTAAGTTLVKNIAAGATAGVPLKFQNVNGTLYFSVNDVVNGRELWKSNGTAAGTVLVKNIRAGSAASDPDNLTNVGGVLYFTADDGTNGVELWKSDGTTAGTVLVKDIFPGIGGSTPKLSLAAGKLYISANDGSGQQAWVTNGLESGTLKSLNAAGQPVAFNPDSVVAVNGVPYFAATSASHGKELFTLNVPREFSATSGVDSFVLTFSTTTVNVTRSVGGAAAVNLGTFPVASPVSLLSLSAADSVRVVGTSGNDTFSVGVSGMFINNVQFLLNGPASLTLAGAAGNDTFRFDADSQLGTIRLDESGGGVDTIDLSPTTSLAVSLNLSSAATQVVNANLSLILGSATTFENGTGGSKNDTLVGNTGNNVLRGNDGNDVLNGTPGSDGLFGGKGDDSYSFGSSTPGEVDTVTELTSEGTDILLFTGLLIDVQLDLSLTSSQVVHTNRSLILASGTTIENVSAGSGNDRLLGNGLANILRGNAGNDIIVGGSGDDQLFGGSGRDLLIGGLGLDRINGEDGDDILIAGRTTSDTVVSKLADLRTQWISGNSYATRITNLRAGVGASVASLKKTVNVLNDAGEDDVLTGSTGTDWYFKAVDDVLTDLFAGEIIDVL